jgi:hypothetical protein
MKREDVLKALMAASELEESYSPIIARFFLKEFDWSGIEDENVQRIKRMLKVIEVQTLEHNKTLDEIASFVKESGENDF